MSQHAVNPRVSIALGAYNCADTLPAALDSILAQTYADWELVICNDGSTDNTAAVAKSYAANDTRIILISNPSNLGLSHALNNCLIHAKGEYYARMDGDDISLPNRLEVLVREMDADPSVAVISSGMIRFDENGDWGTVRTKTNPKPSDLAFGTPFCHAPSIIRKAVLEELGGYGTKPWVRRVEDYHLWFRLYAAGHRGKNLPDLLYKVRDDRNASQRRTFKARLNETRVMWHGFKLLGIKWRHYPRIFRPIILGLMPLWLYEPLRRWAANRETTRSIQS